jgi:hypothetical protein
VRAHPEMTKAWPESTMTGRRSCRIAEEKKDEDCKVNFMRTTSTPIRISVDETVGRYRVKLYAIPRINELTPYK